MEIVRRSRLKVLLTPKFFLSRQKVLFVLVIRFFLIFCEFLKINSKKCAPLWFTAELQREWAESVCDVSCGSQFAWRDDDRVNTLHIRGHRGIIKRGKKNTTLPYRCVAANCHNVVDLSKCIFAHNIPSFGD